MTLAKSPMSGKAQVGSGPNLLFRSACWAVGDAQELRESGFPENPGPMPFDREGATRILKNLLSATSDFLFSRPLVPGAEVLTNKELFECFDSSTDAV
jgi:hypothetical protein